MSHTERVVVAEVLQSMVDEQGSVGGGDGGVLVCMFVCMYEGMASALPRLLPGSLHNFLSLMADMQPQGTAIRTAFQPPLVPARAAQPRLDGHSAGDWRDAFVCICVCLT